MQQQRENNKPLFIFLEAIAYFLAGSFAIKTVLPLHLPDGTLQFSNLFTSVVGGLLIITGFVRLLTILQFKPLKNLEDKFQKCLPLISSTILFPVTVSEVVKVIFDFREIAFLFIITIIFLIFVLVAIGITSLKKVIQDIRLLILSSLAFNILAVIFLLGVGTKYQVISLICISLILLFFALLKLPKQRESLQDKQKNEK